MAFTVYMICRLSTTPVNNSLCTQLLELPKEHNTNHWPSIRCSLNMFSVLFRNEMRMKLWLTVLLAHSVRLHIVNSCSLQLKQKLSSLRSCIQRHEMDPTKVITHLIISRQLTTIHREPPTLR